VEKKERLGFCVTPIGRGRGRRVLKGCGVLWWYSTVHSPASPK